MEHPVSEKALAVLVVSCDKYSDLWSIFFRLLKKYWPDCPYQIYMGSNNVQCEEKGVIPICIGNDIAWTDNVAKMLECIEEPYVLILLEDIFLSARVDNEYIKRLLCYIVDHDIDCLHLHNHYTGIKCMDKELGVQFIEAGSPYYVHAVECIWKKEMLKKFLIPGYSAWDFELKNSKTVKPGEQSFAAVKKNVFEIKNGVIRGKYLKSTVGFLASEGIEVDIYNRGVFEDANIKQRISAQFTRLKLRVYVLLRLYKINFIRDKLHI